MIKRIEPLVIPTHKSTAIKADMDIATHLDLKFDPAIALSSGAHSLSLVQQNTGNRIKRNR